MFVPSIYLADVTAVAQGSPLGVGGQNIWYEDSGAFTGELAFQAAAKRPYRFSLSVEQAQAAE